jgi:hypothetical protein
LRNSDEAITAVCKECPINQYRRGDDNESKTSCTSCPNGYNTNRNRGESLCLKNGLTPEDCGTAQFLNNKNAVSGSSSSGGSGSSSDSSSSSSSSSSPPPPPSTCDACPRGGACDGLTEWSDVTSPANKSKIKPLFGWSRCARSGATSVDHMFERCPFAAACLGAPNIDLEDKFEGGVATQRQPEGCNTAYRNVSDNFLCFGCAPGYSHTSGDMSGKCDECPLPGENVGIAVLGVLLGIAGLFVYVRLTLGDSGSKDASDGVKSIGLSFVQIISLLTTFPVAWPAMFTALFQIGGAVTVLGQHLVNLKCMFPERSEAEVFYSSQVVWAMIPLGLAGASVATWYVVDFVMVKLPRCGCMSRCKRAGAEEVLPQTTTHPSAGTVFARPPTREQQQQQQQQSRVPLSPPPTLHQKMFASIVALLYLVWPGLCSVTFSLFACRSFCGDVATLRLRADLDEVCFQGRHAVYIYAVGVPMLLLYVFGLPVGALLMVRRMRRRAERRNQAVHQCKGHATWGLFYSAFRDDTWWWEGTVALRKIGIAMIGVFGAAMEEMQVSLTLVLVFFIILLTAVRRPYGESPHGQLLQRLEVSTLCLLYLTLWAASVFTVYPRCEIREGQSVWWCEIMSVVVGLGDIALVVVVIALFVRLKGAGASCCLDRCVSKLPELVRKTSARLRRKATREWDLRHGGEDAVQARIRSRTVESRGGSLMDNPMEQCGSSGGGGDGGESGGEGSSSSGGGGSSGGGSSGGGGGSSGSSSRRKGGNQTTQQHGSVEMIEMDMRLSAAAAAAPSSHNRAKRRSYMKRQAALKKLNEHMRTEKRMANINPMMRPPSDDTDTGTKTSTNK